jgi:hypothetical protein
MNFDIENDLRQTLSKDEKLLWTGRPKAGIVFRSSDIFFIPFSLLWFCFAIFWEYNVVKMGINFFALFGLPFIVMGLYISAGRFFIDALKRKNTVYGITDNRIIIKSGIFSKDIKSLNIRTITDLTFREKADGTGTISIGPTDFRYAIFSGMGYWPGLKLPPSLELIDDVKRVYNILIDQQRKS